MSYNHRSHILSRQIFESRKQAYLITTVLNGHTYSINILHNICIGLTKGNMMNMLKFQITLLNAIG